AAKSKKIREGYLDFAAEARRHAASYTQRAQDIDGLEAAIQKQLEFVVESRQFIMDVRGFLAAVPANSGIETEKFIARINEYIAAFESAIQAIKGVSEKIGERPSASGSEPETNPKLPARKAGLGSVSNVKEYKARLSQLKR